MKLSETVRQGGLSTDDAISILGVIESFLVRRAIAGHEPTGLHSVFKRLWLDCAGAPNAALVIRKIRDHKTVAWPGPKDVEAAILSRPLYGTSVTGHILMEWNRSLGGDQPRVEPWIEHVLPVKPDKGWFDSFKPEQHEKMKDFLANLLPLSQEMNQSLGCSLYSVKRPVYEKDSGFKAARSFAEQFAEWNPETLQHRSEELAAWVISRWTY
jgi:hypothetical protein